MNPSPEYPTLQEQENDPGEFLHLALLSHGLLSHSLLSLKESYDMKQQRTFKTNGQCNN